MNRWSGNEYEKREKNIRNYEPLMDCKVQSVDIRDIRHSRHISWSSIQQYTLFLDTCDAHVLASDWVLYYVR